MTWTAASITSEMATRPSTAVVRNVTKRHSNSKAMGKNGPSGRMDKERKFFTSGDINSSSSSSFSLESSAIFSCPDIFPSENRTRFKAPSLPVDTLSLSPKESGSTTTWPGLFSFSDSSSSLHILSMLFLLRDLSRLPLRPICQLVSMVPQLLPLARFVCALLSREPIKSFTATREIPIPASLISLSKVALLVARPLIARCGGRAARGRWVLFGFEYMGPGGMLLVERLRRPLDSSVGFNPAPTKPPPAASPKSWEPREPERLPAPLLANATSRFPDSGPTRIELSSTRMEVERSPMPQSAIALSSSPSTTCPESASDSPDLWLSVISVSVARVTPPVRVEFFGWISLYPPPFTSFCSSKAPWMSSNSSTGSDPPSSLSPKPAPLTKRSYSSLALRLAFSFSSKVDVALVATSKPALSPSSLTTTGSGDIVVGGLVSQPALLLRKFHPQT
mmetsp:Transcript_16084/g.33027  ORF Transcript_16084/g.33027 Transcript_16084/m.33027 type:complete len:450 (-) Transcript_16084:34-1383(-)